MIPKKIHYCWFGRGKKPKLAKKCIESWKKYCPEYEIIEWNEDNFDVYQNEYTKYTYDSRKFAFLSDYARLLIIYNQGGIYFDVDVELTKPFDDFLNDGAFFGFESDEYVNTGIGFGAEKNNQVVKKLLEEYDGLLDGKSGTVGCPILNTKALKKLGLKLNGKKQTISSAVVYPADYFNPYDSPTGRLFKTENTHSIHWFSMTWVSRTTQIRSMLMKPIHRIFGTNLRRQ